MALSVGFIRFVSSTNATQATGALTLSPVGLSPTEHASFSLDALWSKNPICMKSKDDGGRGTGGPDRGVTPRYITKKSRRMNRVHKPAMIRSWHAGWAHACARD